jgi:hypothetical protein
MLPCSPASVPLSLLALLLAPPWCEGVVALLLSAAAAGVLRGLSTSLGLPKGCEDLTNAPSPDALSSVIGSTASLADRADPRLLALPLANRLDLPRVAFASAFCASRSANSFLGQTGAGAAANGVAAAGFSAVPCKQQARARWTERYELVSNTALLNIQAFCCQCRNVHNMLNPIILLHVLCCSCATNMSVKYMH